MTRRVLLPHERGCDAEGCEDGKVWQYSLDRNGDECGSVRVDCENCDGTGVLQNERREDSWLREFIDQQTEDLRDRIRDYIHERDRIDWIVREKRDAAEDDVLRLRLENKSLRGQLHEKNRELEQLRKQHRDAMELLKVSKPDEKKLAEVH